jgi:hypothetical protein
MDTTIKGRSATTKKMKGFRKKKGIQQTNKMLPLQVSSTDGMCHRSSLAILNYIKN